MHQSFGDTFEDSETLRSVTTRLFVMIRIATLNSLRGVTVEPPDALTLTIGMEVDEKPL
jgi:hypothetical protein